MSNSELKWLEEISTQAREIASKKEAAEKAIREGFKEKAIVFIDVVGSTEFKKRYPETPEVWILRVKQFSDLLASAIKKCNGNVVKYIGDEVMGSFENINDAKNLVARISEIEETLRIGTGFETRIKTSIDFGLVYEIEFDGHAILDPQGSTVDRCARIAKYTTSGEVLASASFVENTPQLNWKKVGSVELKGLGKEVIYQLERVTISLDERIEIKKDDFNKITEEIQEIKTENSHLKETIKQLREQVEKSGQKPINGALEVDEENSWSEVENAIQKLVKIIEDAPVSSRYYARFIFLDNAGKGPEKYSSYEDKVFDDLIETNLVISDDGKYFILNSEHPRNKRKRPILPIVTGG